MAVLTQDELKQAVKEWCEKRGLPSTGEVEFITVYRKGLLVTSPSSENGNYTFHAQVKGLELPIKEGPYR